MTDASPAEQQQRMTTAILAALEDPRVTILCLQKGDASSSREVLQAIASSNNQLRIELYDRVEADKYRIGRVQSLAKQINSYNDARALRSTLDYIYEIGQSGGHIPHYIQRNGFISYLRSLRESDLIDLLQSTYMTWFPAIGNPFVMGKGPQRVVVYDNVGKLISEEGLEIWLKRRSVAVQPRQIDRLLILAGDYEFPPEVADIGRWGYSVNLTKADFGIEPEQFSPVKLDWRSDVLTATSRADESGFSPQITRKTLDATYQALDALAKKVVERIPYEQVDQRITTVLASYREELANLEPNPILLDCFFETYCELISYEGASNILESLNGSLIRTHKAVVSSSPACRELERASRMISDDDELPHQIIESLATEIAAAESESVVDSSVTEAADELVTADADSKKGSAKRKIVLAGFVKAIVAAMKQAPVAVRGIKAFQDLFAMAERAREYLISHWHTWFN